MSRVKIELPHAWHYQTQITVQIGDINYGNHLSNDAYLRLAHEARLRFLKHFNYSEMDIDGAGLIMADAAIQFKNQAFHGDVLNISIAVTDIGRAGFTLIYLFERVSDGLQIGRIKNGMVFYDYQQQCVANTPAAFSAAFVTEH